MSDKSLSSRTLSHSQMDTFCQCPRRWYLTKIARVPQAPSEHLVFGTAIHAAIEEDGRRIAAGRLALPLTYLLATFSAALERECVQVDPHGLLAATIPELRVRGIAVLRAYLDAVQPHYSPTEIEYAFEQPVPNCDGWRFTGRIDALTVHGGQRTIVDLKTASKPWPAGAEHDKDQATAYLWADMNDFIEMPGEPVTRRVTFITLPTARDQSGDGYTYTCTPDFRTTSRSPAQVAHWLTKVRSTVQGIEDALRVGGAQAFVARTGPLCGWCSVLGSCETGQRWLADHGRQPAVPIVPMVRTPSATAAKRVAERVETIETVETTREVRS